MKTPAQIAAAVALVMAASEGDPLHRRGRFAEGAFRDGRDVTAKAITVGVFDR